MSRGKGERLYKHWDGKNGFCCCGKIYKGPASDCGAQVCVIIFIAGAGVLYYGVFASYLAEEISIWLVVFWSLLYFCLIVSYLLTACIDPGVIPARKFFDVTPGAINRMQDAHYYLDKFVDGKSEYISKYVNFPHPKF
jgi:hypothetical protein